MQYLMFIRTKLDQTKSGEIFACSASCYVQQMLITLGMDLANVNNFLDNNQEKLQF